MSLQDPVADMFTRINNAVAARHPVVTMQDSVLKRSIASVLQKEGYIEFFEPFSDEKGLRFVRIGLKYRDGSGVLRKLRRVSKPGLRVYRGKSDLPKVLGGLGCAILSTSSGVMTDHEARQKGVGGEVLGLVQ